MTPDFSKRRARFLILACNRPGVLARIVSAISAFGETIERVEAWALTDPADVAIVQLVLPAEAPQQDRMTRKLQKLIDVIEVSAGEFDSNLTLLTPVGATAPETCRDGAKRGECA